MPKLGATTPILRIFDIAKAHEFYVGFLGFDVQ
ncbi:MAG: glyoxalase superfamily protein, partial [Mesorhizobium sp.]